MTTRPVAVRVSQATRLEGSSARQASRIASEIWSAILSGWPSVTDSEVNRNLSRGCGKAASSYTFIAGQPECDWEFIQGRNVAGRQPQQEASRTALLP